MLRRVQSLDAARRILSEHRVPQLVGAWKEREAEVAGIAHALAEVERRIPWWERAAFFHDSTDEKRAAALRAELEQAARAAAEARQACDDAVRRCAELSPPIEIAFRIESVIDRVRSDPEIGRTTARGASIGAALDEIVERVAALWLPGVELPTLAARLLESESLHQLAAPESAAMDARLGWAPLDAQDLYARAARELAVRGELAAAREALAQQLVQRQRVLEHLTLLEEQVGFFDKLLPDQNSSAERARNQARKVLSAEERSVIACVDRAHHAVVQAIAAAHPISWLALSAAAAATSLRAIKPQKEWMLASSGGVAEVWSAYGRAVVIAALVELRRACDAALPGLGERVWPRRGAPEDPHESPMAGPYRIGGFVERDPEAVRKGASAESRAFFTSLERSELRGQLGWAVASATSTALLEMAHAQVTPQIGWLDRAVFWSESADESRERELEERLTWHRHLIRWHSLEALSTVERHTHSHPLLRTGRAIVAAHAALKQVATLGGQSSTSRACPVFGAAEAHAQLQIAIGALCAHYGGIADREALVEAICRRIETGTAPIAAPSHAGSFAEIVDLLASHLQSTSFAPFVREVQMNRPLAEIAQQRAAQAEAGVSLLDRLNVFTDSAQETERDRASEEARARRHHADAHYRAARQLYHQALALHPPTALAAQGLEIGDHIAAIRAHSARRTRRVGPSSRRRTVTYYVCVLSGREEAFRALHAWTQHVIARLGAFPCAGELLEEWVRAELA